MSTEEKPEAHPYQRGYAQTDDDVAKEAASDYALAHAAGYAEAVADVVALLEEEIHSLEAGVLLWKIGNGAHVGAAKKG